MSAVELKSCIHEIVDGIQNEQFLRTLYDFLKNRENDGKLQFWDSLTEEQKQEVLLAFEESENDANLVSSKDVFGND